MGTIRLAPGDTLNISIPHTRLQIDAISPIPDHLMYPEAGAEDRPIVTSYVGPASFDLSLPYVPQTNLYASQFPAVLRPLILPIKEQLGNLFPVSSSGVTWLLLGSGLLLYLFSVFVPGARGFPLLGWLLIAISFFYGVRGSFGLLCVALLFHVTQTEDPPTVLSNWRQDLPRLARGLAGFGLVAFAVYADRRGFSLFTGLAESELSPLTPLILMVLAIALFLLLYGSAGSKMTITTSDLPVLSLLLVVLSLYDAFDKSLLSLLILFAGGVIARLTSRHSDVNEAPQSGEPLTDELRTRWDLAFGNRIVPFALLVLMIFAIGHDLSSTFANEMQVQLPPGVAPLLIPLLSFISVFLTFSSVAVLFVLVYPYIPLKTGYLKAAAFALFLFLIFLFGIATDDRLIASLPDLLVGRVVYYLSVPMLIGVYLDINEFMQKENKRLSGEGKEKEALDFRTASSLYLKDLRGLLSTAAGIVSLVAPTVYAFVSDQPVFATYFDLLEKLVVLSV
jgi:hypothetical protein